MTNRSLKLRARFALVLLVLVPALLAVGGAGLYGLQSERSSVSSLYTDNIRTAQAATQLGVYISNAYVASLELQLVQGDESATSRITNEFNGTITTDIDTQLATVRANSADRADETADVQIISASWNYLQEFRASGGLVSRSASARSTRTLEVDAIFVPMTNAADSLVDIEAGEAKASYQHALDSYSSSVELMIIVLIIGLIIAVGLILWLVQSVLKRTVSYSIFANAVSEGDYSQHLSPRGNDEIDQLGTTLEHLAARRHAEEQYERSKLEFTDTLQVTETEQEAHELLKRYLERSIDTSTVTVLNRNNSADRLEAVTTVPEGAVLSHSLDGAKPRSCLAVRMARAHVGNSSELDPLLACSVCGDCPARTLCVPLLVGGEVIGSVLSEHPEEMTDYERRSIRDAVGQSAPVLGNLRNLAIAELRSSTDPLTGLPNRRAIEDTLKRMVAQSSRTMSSLAALMCDLDHFKRVNDHYGHGSGDDVLAAVGAALADTVRSSDFVGRYGGEEFLILLPSTSIDGAKAIAEQIRGAVAEIRVPTVPDRVTLSVGIAVLPDQAGDAVSLSRAADRALYAAKNAGRDRVEVFQARSNGAKLGDRVVSENGTAEREASGPRPRL